MNQLEQVVHETIREVLGGRSSAISRIENHQSLNEDLGFASLDVAQLVAMLEIRLGVDPFAEHVAITDVRTVGDMIEAYRSGDVPAAS